MSRGVRREIGIRTVFNLLGPLTNPACTGAQLIGVYSPELTGTFCEVLRRLGTVRGMVVHGNGMDEITTIGMTNIAELKNGMLNHGAISCLDYGIPELSRKTSPEGIRGRMPEFLPMYSKGKKAPAVTSSS